VKLKRIRFSIFAISLLVCSVSYAKDTFSKYIDIPYCGVLPNESISKVFSIYGKTKPIGTKLAHNYVLYYDYGKNVGLIVRVYKMATETIWDITIRKEGGEDAIRNLHKYASNGVPEQDQSELIKPHTIELPDKLTLKGLKFGMSLADVEGRLKSRLRIKGQEAQIGWETEDGAYGGLDLIFNNGRLMSLTWYGVDP
jgi:hypothetical protein